MSQLPKNLVATKSNWMSCQRIAHPPWNKENSIWTTEEIIINNGDEQWYPSLKEKVPEMGSIYYRLVISSPHRESSETIIDITRAMLTKEWITADLPKPGYTTTAYVWQFEGQMDLYKEAIKNHLEQQKND